MCCTSCVLVVMVGLADGGARGGLLFVVFDICGWSPACTSQTTCPRGGGVALPLPTSPWCPVQAVARAARYPLGASRLLLHAAAVVRPD